MIVQTMSALAALGLIVASPAQARSEEILLSCWGTVELIREGKLVNPQDEKSSLAVAVDIGRKIITIKGVKWPIAGDASNEVVVSMDPEKGSISLNRITGAVNVHFIEYDGLKKFYGKCKPGQRMF